MRLVPEGIAEVIAPLVVEEVIIWLHLGGIKLVASQCQRYFIYIFVLFFISFVFHFCEPCFLLIIFVPLQIQASSGRNRRSYCTASSGGGYMAAFGRRDQAGGVPMPKI